MKSAVVSSRVVLFICSFLTVASAAVAEDEPDYSRSGFYGAVSLAAGTSTGLADFLEPSLPAGEKGRTDAAIGVNARVGMRVLRYLAVEGQVEYLPGFDVKISNDEKVLDGDLLVGAVNTKGYFLAWHETGRFEPFLSVGFGFMQNWAGDLGEATSFAARAGGGFDGYFTEHLACTVEVQYVIPTDANTEWDYVSLTAGLMYKF